MWCKKNEKQKKFVEIIIFYLFLNKCIPTPFVKCCGLTIFYHSIHIVCFYKSIFVGWLKVCFCFFYNPHCTL